MMTFCGLVESPCRYVQPTDRHDIYSSLCLCKDGELWPPSLLWFPFQWVALHRIYVPTLNTVFAWRLTDSRRTDGRSVGLAHSKEYSLCATVRLRFDGSTLLRVSFVFRILGLGSCDLVMASQSSWGEITFPLLRASFFVLISRHGATIIFGGSQVSSNEHLNITKED